MKQLVKVYMLPTEDKTDIHETKHGRLYYQQASFDPVIYQHLYFASDEEIKEGEWCINEGDYDKPLIFRADREFFDIGLEAKKILATTDKSLLIEIESDSMKFDKPVGVPLPQISQQFIEDYCKVGGIDEVYLEQVEGKTTYEICSGNPYYTTEYLLKLDSSNCVIIHLVKESWNRKEIETLFNRYNEFIAHHEPEEWQGWIKENLK